MSFALAIAFLSLVTSMSPGESWRTTSALRLTRTLSHPGAASHRRDSEQATGSSPASGPAAASSVGTVYPPSTRFSSQGPYLAGSVLIGFHSGVSAAQRHAIEHAAGALGQRRLGPVIKPVGHGRATGAEYLSPFELRLPDGLVFSAVARLRRDPGVAYAEPNYLERATAIEPPNDPKFPEQWGDENTGQAIPFQDASEKEGAKENGTPGADDHALAAWNSLEAAGKTVGSRSIVIGEVDTGVDYTHPDLKANIWSNPGGIGQNEKKEHICAAGTHGYNVLNETCNPIDEDTDYGGHGTHVAGIMGAEGNNGEGVAGMNWQTTILPVRWLNKASTLSPTSELVKALLWLVGVKQEGENVRVVNDSDVIEGKTGSTALENAIESLGANNILFVTAAGNTGKNNDEVERYPCKYDRPTEICVAASNNKDALPSWASYGPKTVDLAAPGTSIYSTLRGGKYGYLSGGSMASPQVAGAAALILSVKPTFSTTELKADILNNVDKLPSLEGKVITGGRLDVCKALPGCPRGSQPTVTTNVASSITQTTATLNGSVNPDGRTVTDCHFDYGTSESYGSSAPCSSLPGSGESAVAVSALTESLSANTTYHFRIVATNSGGTSDGNDQAFVTLPNPPTVTTNAASSLTQGSATLNGTVNSNGSAASDCYFEYGSSPSYGSTVPCASLPGAGTGSVEVSAMVESLSARTTYHFRIAATNSGGTSQGSDQTLITLPARPTVVTEPASSVTQSSATLNATVDPNGVMVEDCRFEYGTSLSYGSTVACSAPAGSGNSPVAESAPLAGLSPLTTYYARVVVTNSAGTSDGATEFTTLPAQGEPNPPTAVTGTPSALTQSSATLNATVNPEGASVTECHFDYGTSMSFGSSLPCTSLPESGQNALPVSAPAEGLAAGASYYYRIVATNAGGTSYGAAQAFTTQLVTAPFVAQGPGSQWPFPGQGVLANQENKTPPVANAELASTALVVTSAGTVRVKVICPAGQRSWAGTVALWTFKAVSVGATGHRLKKHKTAVLTLAHGSFTGVGGGATTVMLRLSAKARALLARTNTLHARATIVLRDSQGVTHANEVIVTLRPLAAVRRGVRG